MLQLTKRTEYGLIALVHLADHEGEVVSAREIGEFYPVPKRLLAEVLKGLPLGLTEAALEAVRETRFQPVLDEQSRPVSVEFHHVVTFSP